MGSNATQIPWFPWDLNPCGQAVRKGPGSWCSVEFVQSSCLTWVQPKGCTSVCFLLAGIPHVRGRGCMVSETSHRIRVATYEMKKLKQLLCSPSCTATQSFPSAGSSGDHLSPLGSTTFSVPVYPAALLLVNWYTWLSTQKAPVFSSVSSCPCWGWGNVIPCGNFEGRTRKNNDSRTKHMALHQFWESEIQLQVRPSAENLL